MDGITLKVRAQLHVAHRGILVADRNLLCCCSCSPLCARDLSVGINGLERVAAGIRSLDCSGRGSIQGSVQAAI